LIEFETNLFEIDVLKLGPFVDGQTPTIDPFQPQTANASLIFWFINQYCNLLLKNIFDVKNNNNSEIKKVLHFERMSGIRLDSADSQNARVFVGNVAPNTDQDLLLEHFKKHGKISGVVVLKGFAFVQVSILENLNIYNYRKNCHKFDCFDQYYG